MAGVPRHKPGRLSRVVPLLGLLASTGVRLVCWIVEEVLGMAKASKGPKIERARDPLLDAIGHKIKVARVQAGFNQNELGAAIGASQGWIFLVEDGQQNLQIRSLQRIADALNVSVRSLFPYDEGMGVGSDRAGQVEDVLKALIAETTQALGAMQQTLNLLHKAALLMEGQGASVRPAPGQIN